MQSNGTRRRRGIIAASLAMLVFAILLYNRDEFQTAPTDAADEDLVTPEPSNISSKAHEAERYDVSHSNDVDVASVEITIVVRDIGPGTKLTEVAFYDAEGVRDHRFAIDEDHGYRLSLPHDGKRGSWFAESPGFFRSKFFISADLASSQVEVGLRRRCSAHGRLVPPPDMVTGQRVEAIPVVAIYDKGFHPWAETQFADVKLDGTFSWERLAAGVRYKVKCQWEIRLPHPPIQFVAISPTIDIGVIRDAPRSHVIVEVVDAEGRPLSGATVWCGSWFQDDYDGSWQEGSQRAEYKHAVTDGSGTVLYWVRRDFVHRCYAQRDNLAACSSTVNLLGPKDKITLRLEPTSSITGRVLSESTQRAVSNVNVLAQLSLDETTPLFQFDQCAATKTNENGEFELAGCLPGVAYDVIASARVRISPSTQSVFSPARDLIIYVRESPTLRLRIRSSSDEESVRQINADSATGESLPWGSGGFSLGEDGSVEIPDYRHLCDAITISALYHEPLTMTWNDLERRAASNGLVDIVLTPFETIRLQLNSTLPYDLGALYHYQYKPKGGAYSRMARFRAKFQPDLSAIGELPWHGPGDYRIVRYGGGLGGAIGLSEENIVGRAVVSWDSFPNAGDGVVVTLDLDTE